MAHDSASAEPARVSSSTLARPPPDPRLPRASVAAKGGASTRSRCPTSHQTGIARNLRRTAFQRLSRLTRRISVRLLSCIAIMPKQYQMNEKRQLDLFWLHRNATRTIYMPEAPLAHILPAAHEVEPIKAGRQLTGHGVSMST